MASSEMAMSAAARAEPLEITSIALAKMTSTTNNRPTNFLHSLRSAFDGRGWREVPQVPIQSRKRWNTTTSVVIRACSTSVVPYTLTSCQPAVSQRRNPGSTYREHVQKCDSLSLCGANAIAVPRPCFEVKCL